MKKTLLLTAVLFLGEGGAGAMHPLLSEDTGFLARGGRQIETGFEYTQASGEGNSYSRSLAAELSYGLTGSSDLLFTVPWTGWTAGGYSQNGLADTSLEVKFRIWEKAGWTFAFKPGLSFPYGDENKGLGSGKSCFWTYAVAGRISDPWQFYLNAGYLFNGNSAGEEENIFKASAAAAFEIKPKTLLSADLAAETNSDPASGTHPISAIFGIIWFPYDTLDLDAGVKFGLNSTADDIGLLAGATFRF